MIGWLIYEKEEAKKNQGAIDLFLEAGERHGLQIQLTDCGNLFMDERTAKDSLPDVVINRSRDWQLGAWFEQRGIRVFNSSEITRIGNDKYETYRIMEQLNVPVLPFRLGNVTRVREFAHFPFVLKSCRGHGGEEVFWVASKRQYEEAVQKLGKEPFVMQQPATDVGKDIRLFVVNNQVRAAMLRTSAMDFRSNYSLGGQVEMWRPDTESRRIAEQIANKIFERFQIDYAGIDLLLHEGKPVFNELEDMVGARMLYQHTQMDIIGDFVAYICKEIM